MFVCRTVCEQFYESFNYKEAKAWTKKYTQGLLGLRTVSVFAPKWKGPSVFEIQLEGMRTSHATPKLDFETAVRLVVPTPFAWKLPYLVVVPGPQSQHVPLLGPRASVGICWLLHINKHLWKKHTSTAPSSPSMIIIHWKCHTYIHGTCTWKGSP